MSLPACPSLSLSLRLLSSVCLTSHTHISFEHTLGPQTSGDGTACLFLSRPRLPFTTFPLGLTCAPVLMRKVRRRENGSRKGQSLRISAAGTVLSTPIYKLTDNRRGFLPQKASHMGSQSGCRHGALPLAGREHTPAHRNQQGHRCTPWKDTPFPAWDSRSSHITS